MSDILNLQQAHAEISNMVRAFRSFAQAEHALAVLASYEQAAAEANGRRDAALAALADAEAKLAEARDAREAVAASTAAAVEAAREKADGIVEAAKAEAATIVEQARAEAAGAMTAERERLAADWSDLQDRIEEARGQLDAVEATLAAKRAVLAQLAA